LFLVLDHLVLGTIFSKGDAQAHNLSFVFRPVSDAQQLISNMLSSQKPYYSARVKAAEMQSKESTLLFPNHFP
jgi:cytochrome c556